ncbi:extracellular solute-binding protein [Spiractinospora alimapuensis]|uniref:ABC transporter substrate-binding protein n=1 Tax=Spiractinospora alimapuensis TaxID=2820884 RepID=UPI001F352AFD|nr:extracellular solute-binding protein [Spiractinospora alimapuensis]QVQ52221.1 extracellular solute-binding protein [Spiractinospora alimapuensis]
MITPHPSAPRTETPRRGPHRTPRGGALLAAGALLLTACSNGGAQEDADLEEASADLQVVWPGTSDVEMAVAEDFQADIAEINEDVRLEYDYMSWDDMQDQLAIQIQAGNPPDVTMTQDVTDLVRLGGLMELDDNLAESSLDAEEFRPGTLEYTTRDDSLYALPYLAQAFTLIVNEDLLADAGLEVEDLQTWEELEEAAEAMTTDDTYGFAFPMGEARFAFRGMMTAAYSNDLLMDDTGPEFEERWVELLDHLDTLREYRPNADATWDYSDMFRAYANGEVGMIPAGTFFTANVYELNPDIVGASRQLAYPRGPSAEETRAPVSTVGYGVFADSDTPNLSWQIVQRLVDDEWVARQAAVVHVPARDTVTMDDIRPQIEEVYPDAVEGQEQQITDAMELIDSDGVPLEPVVGQSAMEPEVQEVLRDLSDGDIASDEAYALLMERITEVQENQD